MRISDWSSDVCSSDLDNLRLKRFEIDTLMLVAAAGAGALGAWAEGALLLFLFSLGHALEHYAMGRAKRAIEALAELAPRTAMVRRGDGELSEVPVEELVIRSEEHTSELQSLMRISYAVFCLKQ